MSVAPVLTEGRAASSMGERLYAAHSVAFGPFFLRFHQQTPTQQAKYERAAVSFVASLTYAESVGVREALLSTVLLDALRTAERFMAGFEGDPLQDGIDADLAEVRRAIAQAEGRADG
jgi:hypothetical protein